MKNLILVLFSAALLFSCTSAKNNKEAVTAKDTTPAITHSVKDYKGFYHPGQFIDMENSELHTFPDSIQKKLDSLYNKILPNHYPNQTVFMRFKGIADSLPTNTGFSTSLVELISLELKSAFNTDIHYDYWCRGNEPFWQIQISEKENLIDFFDPMTSNYTHFSFVKPEINQNKTIYIAEDKTANNKIKITIINEKCSDGMSEREYQYKSEVVLNGMTYKGCAESPSHKAQ